MVSSEGFEIKLALELARQTSAGVVCAGIEFHLDGHVFPARGWTDLAVVVLSALSDAAVRLLRGVLGPIAIRFMEGPYSIELTSTSSSTWHAALIETRQHREIRAASEFDAAEFLENLVKESSPLLSLCHERGWWSQDAERLRAATRAMIRPIS